MGALVHLALVQVAAATIGNGTWKQTYPPWGEPASPMFGKPELFIPIMGPLTVHTCMPSRYFAQRIAASHLNRRDATFCPAIAELRHDFEVRYMLRDSHASGEGAVVAAMQLLEADMSSGRDIGSEEARVKVVLGPNSSPEAAGVHPFLGGALRISHLSWAATRGALGNKDVYKYFFRIVAPDSATMATQAGFMHWLGYAAANVLLVDDQGVAVGQAEDFKAAASLAYGMQVQVYRVPASGVGGAPLSDAGIEEARANLLLIRRTQVRVVGLYAMNREVGDVFRVADELGMVRGPGWFWFGGDGMTVALTGDASIDEELKPLIQGSIFVLQSNNNQQWDAFQSAWRASAAGMDAPEFSQQKICHGSVACEDHAEFYGVDRAGTRCLNSWLQEAYVAMITLAVVADRIMGVTGKVPARFTSQDWYDGLKTLQATPFTCLSGMVQLNERQERAAGLAFLQWQVGVEGMVQVAAWDASAGYYWMPGVTVVFGDGSRQTISSANASIVLPSGKPPSCPDGQAYDEDEQRCRPCPEGYVALVFNGIAICTCDVGYGLEPGTEGCQLCAKGKAKAQPGGQACGPCSAGRASADLGATSCSACALGTFASGAGRSACSPCGEGFTTLRPEAANRSECLCGEDHYERDGSCIQCAAGAMTNGIGKTAAHDCFCPQGTYKPKDNPEACEACKGGMVCESRIDKRLFGSVERGGTAPEGRDLEPRLSPMYWSSAEETLLVFRCSTPQRCPGGLPGDATACAPMLRGRACANCAEGWRWGGERCERCVGSGSVGLLVVGVLVGPLVVLLLYRLFGDTYERWNSPQNGCAAIVFIVVNHYQIITVMGGADVAFPVSFRSVVGGVAFTNDVLTLVKPQCLGLSSFSSRLQFKTVGPVIIASVFAVTWTLSRLLAKVVGNDAVAMEPNRTLNGFLSLMFTFFASVAEMGFLLFKCASNTQENDKMSLVADRSIICFEEEWNSMLAVGVTAVVLWVGGFGGLFLRTVIVAPSWFHDKAAQMRWKFLFIKYRPDVHWWALVFIAKSVLVNLGFVFLDSGVGHVYWVVLIVFTYSTGVILFMPWRHVLVNYVDIWSHHCILLLGAVLTWFARDPQASTSASDEAMSKMLMAFSFLALPVSMCVVFFMFWLRMSAKAKKKQEEDIKKMRIAMQQIGQAMEDDFVTFVKGLTEWDHLHLQQAANTVLGDYMGFKARRGLSTRKPSISDMAQLELSLSICSVGSRISTSVGSRISSSLANRFSLRQGLARGGEQEGQEGGKLQAQGEDWDAWAAPEGDERAPPSILDGYPDQVVKRDI